MASVALAGAIPTVHPAERTVLSGFRNDPHEAPNRARVSHQRNLDHQLFHDIYARLANRCPGCPANERRRMIGEPEAGLSVLMELDRLGCFLWGDVRVNGLLSLAFGILRPASNPNGMRKSLRMLGGSSHTSLSLLRQITYDRVLVLCIRMCTKIKCFRHFTSLSARQLISTTSHDGYFNRAAEGVGS